MRRLLVLVSSIVLVETIFFSALAPILPQYSDDLGLSKTASGILVAAYAAGGFAAAIPSGMLVTRLGAKATSIIGLLVLASTSAIFGWADSLWLLDLARFGQGIGSALAWTAGLTWIVAASPRHSRGELIGIAMGAAVGGALLGPVLGGVASVVGTGPAFSAVAAVALGLAAWAWTMPRARAEERPPMRALLTAFRSPKVTAGIWFILIPSLLFGVLGVLAPLRLDELGVAELGISAVFFVAAAIEAVLSPFLGRFSDRYGRLLPLRLALVGAIVITLLLPWPDGRWLLAVLVTVASIVFAVFFVPGTALLSDGADEVGIGQGFGFALLNVGWAPGNLVGSAVGGGLADALGDVGPYFILAGICGLTLLALERGPLATLRGEVPPARLAHHGTGGGAR